MIDTGLTHTGDVPRVDPPLGVAGMGLQAKITQLARKQSLVGCQGSLARDYPRKLTACQLAIYATLRCRELEHLTDALIALLPSGRSGPPLSQPFT